jgi:hypothetical protein
VALLFSCVDSVVGADTLLTSLRADRDSAQLLRRAVSARPHLLRSADGDADALYELLRAWRAFGRETNIDGLLSICLANLGRPTLNDNVHLAQLASTSVDAAQFAAQGLSGAALGNRLEVARREAIQAALDRRGLLT